MRGGIILLLFFLWLLSGDDGPRTEILQKALKELREEASVCDNRSFSINVSYPFPRAVSEELTKLFNPEGRVPRAHYYHNVTGSFKGDWEFDGGIASEIDQEFPLPSAPKADDDTSKNGSSEIDQELPLPSAPKADDDKSKNGTVVGDNGGTSGTTTTSDDKPTTLDPGVTNSTKEEGADEKPADTIEDNKPTYLEDVDKFRGSFRFNESGRFVFNLKETKANEHVNWVKGIWRLRHDDNEDYGIALKVQGVHFVHNGSFYMWGIPEESRMPIWRILDLMPDNASFVLAASALKEQYQHKIKTLENVLAGYNNLEYPETTITETSSCHYQMYMQLGAIDPGVRSSALKDLEREWVAPQGISTIKAPRLNSTLFIYSPNCRLSLVVKKAEGMKREKFYSKAVNYAGIAGTIAFIQVFLLVRQMEYTPTPSSVAKVSYWTIALQVFADSYLCMLHLMTGVLVDFLFIPFVAASFFSFVFVAIFGVRYMLVIWRIQRPERRGRRNQAAAAAAAANSATNNANASGESTTVTATTRAVDIMPGGLPLPVTAARPTPAEDTDSPRADIQALYGRFYWMLVISLIILYKILISSTRVQHFMISISAVCIYSFWIPQIVRNVTRGSKRGLDLGFMLGMSVTRLAMPIYFYGCPENVIGNEPTQWVWGLVLWVALQVGVLLLQDWLGPRFFVPKKYLPPIYDYHPVLPGIDQESGGAGHTHQDCAICLLPIDTASHSGAARLSSVVGSLGRLNYMMTPCGHLFHSDCLERWMRIKLECPHCRAYLPFI